MSIKATFSITAEPSFTNPATTVPHLTTIQIRGQQTVYAFPDHFKDLTYHDALMALPIAKLAKKELKPRWTRRFFNVTLDETLAKFYFDEDENPVFNQCLLTECDFSATSSSTSSHALQKETTVSAAPTKALSSIVKEAVIPKFGGKNNFYNATSWIDLFEKECKRLMIEDDRFWEVLRLFLEDSAEKWYHTRRLTSNSQVWSSWRDSFIENFGITTMASIRHAYYFKYVSGSVCDYAQTKLNLLTSLNPHMHEADKIAQVALGLPRHMQDRLNLADVTTVVKLLSAISSFNAARPSSSTPISSSSDFAPASKFTPTPVSKSPCGFCLKKGFERYHFERDCFTKARSQRFRDNSSNYSNHPKPQSNATSSGKAINSFNLEEARQEILELEKNE
jgi:hypothetical protein